MSHDRLPEGRSGRDARQAELIARCIDGESSEECLSDLADVLRDSAASRDALVGHLLLDALLREELGGESLSALIDIVASGGQATPIGADAPPAGDGTRGATVSSKRGRSRSRSPSLRSGTDPYRTLGWAGAAVMVLASLIVGSSLWDVAGAASAAHLIEAAEDVHAGPVERVYLVDVVREADETAEFAPPRDVRVATRGDQFYVEMNRGNRHWFWGRDAAGAIWMTVGRKQAIVVEEDEQGRPLRHIGNLYALNLETLLRTFRKFCSLTQSTSSAGTHRIDVTPRSALIREGLRHATIEVDRETKAVRRLVLERDSLEFGRSTVSFTLVETRPADEGRYGAIGHLEEPARIIDRTTSPDGRRELLVKWFGSQANGWIRGTKETWNAN